MPCRATSSRHVSYDAQHDATQHAQSPLALFRSFKSTSRGDAVSAGFTSRHFQIVKMMVGVVVCAHFMCVTLHDPCMLNVRSIAACYLVSCRVPFCTLACPLPVLTAGHCFGRATACRRRNRAQSRGQCMPHNAAHNSSEREGPHTCFWQLMLLGVRRKHRRRWRRRSGLVGRVPTHELARGQPRPKV